MYVAHLGLVVLVDEYQSNYSTITIRHFIKEIIGFVEFVSLWVYLSGLTSTTPICTALLNWPIVINILLETIQLAPYPLSPVSDSHRMNSYPVASRLKLAGRMNLISLMEKYPIHLSRGCLGKDNNRDKSNIG